MQQDCQNTECTPHRSGKFRVQGKLKELGQEGGRRKGQCARDSRGHLQTQPLGTRVARKVVLHPRGSGSCTTPTLHYCSPYSIGRSPPARGEAHVWSVILHSQTLPSPPRPRSALYPTHERRCCSWALGLGVEGPTGVTACSPTPAASSRPPLTSDRVTACPQILGPPTFTLSSAELGESSWDKCVGAALEAGRLGTCTVMRSRDWGWGCPGPRCASEVALNTWFIWLFLPALSLGWVATVLGSPRLWPARILVRRFRPDSALTQFIGFLHSAGE